MQMLKGTLCRYGSASANVAFITGTKHNSLPLHSNLRVPSAWRLIKPLCCAAAMPLGMRCGRYAAPLAEALDRKGWSLVQPLLSSSHMGWGTASLDGDADELAALAACLHGSFASEGFVLMGHSTGAQDAVRYAARHKGSTGAAALLGVILQAPVSDREWFMHDMPQYAERLAAAQRLVDEGRGEEIMLRMTEWDGAPLTARRWVALAARGGDDDMFSSDFSDGELRERLAPLAGTPTLILVSGSDEYVPPHVDVAALGSRLAAAIGPTARAAVVAGAPHALRGKEQEGVAQVVAFLDFL